LPFSNGRACSMSKVKAALGWLERWGWVITIIFILVGFHSLHDQGSKLRSDERSHNDEAAHTRVVQKAGEPTGVCLREAAKAALPVLIDFAGELEKAETKAPLAERAVVELFVRLTRKIEAPLQAYVVLQEKRYAGVACPSGLAGSSTP
jgi:hypothetical protein